MTMPEDPNERSAAERAHDIGYRYEAEYGSCSQCVLAAVNDVLGGVDDEVFRASHGLAGGVGMSGQGTCGALSGGIMALGTRSGRKREEFETVRQVPVHELSKRLYDRFIEEYGAPTCRKVQARIFGRSFDLWDDDEVQLFLDMGGHEDKCPSVVGNVAKWVCEILEDTGTP